MASMAPTASEAATRLLSLQNFKVRPFCGPQLYYRLWTCNLYPDS